MNRGFISRTIRSVATVMAVIFSVSSLTAAFPSNSFWRQQENYDTNTAQLAAAIALNFGEKCGFAVFLGSLFDTVGNAAAWLGATRRVIARFAQEVHAVASEAADDLGIYPAAVDVTHVTHMTSSQAIGGDNVLDGGIAVEVGTENPKQRAAQATIKRSFNDAWRMTRAANCIFALPLSVFFVVIVIRTGQWWYELIVSGSGSLLWTLGFTGVPVMLLLWASTAGDEYLNARASLLRPDTSLSLLKVLGRDEAHVLAASLMRTQLGIDLCNVTVTSQKVLYVIFSLMVFATYMVPK